MSLSSGSGKAPSIGEYNFRVIIVGDSTVGKTSLLLRFVDNTFRGDNVTTNGATVKTKTVPFGKKNIKIDIVDTCGQEMFRTISRSIYHGANAAIVVYDQTNEKSFQNMQFWLREVEKYADRSCQKVIVASKADLKTVVPIDSGKAFASSKSLPFFETSAKEDRNVDQVFQSVVQAVGNTSHQGEEWTRFKVIKTDSQNFASTSGSNSNSPPKKKPGFCVIL